MWPLFISSPIALFGLQHGYFVPSDDFYKRTIQPEVKLLF